MTLGTLCDLEIVNFRSIRGKLNAPLDSKIVLIHGENGAGKTSLLSAIELALTGRVVALRRADPNYAAQLLHRDATAGSVEVRMTGAEGPATYRSTMEATGLSVGATLDADLAGFFAERCYLPQSLLGQLLQIYQESELGASSPLARFVGDLLGLDRLDALEAGLKSLSDVRNVRKISEGWSHAEGEMSRLEHLLADKRGRHTVIDSELDAAKADLAVAALQVGHAYDVTNEVLDAAELAFSDTADDQALDQLTALRRELNAIRREAEHSTGPGETTNEGAQTLSVTQASTALDDWRTTYGVRVDDARANVETLIPSLSLPQDHEAFYREALSALSREQALATERSRRGATDAARGAAASDELTVAQKQLETIDLEIGQLSGSSSGLSSALAELTAYIAGDICPVCDRDYSDLSLGSLTDHVHRKVRILSSSAERLLTLSRSRGEQQAMVEALEREINALNARQIEPRALADLARRAASLDSALAELQVLAGILVQGARLEAQAIIAHRTLTESQSRDLAGRAARQTLQDFAVTMAQPGPAEAEAVQDAANRLAKVLNDQIQALNSRLTSRRRGRDAIVSIRAAIGRRNDLDASIATDAAALELVEHALKRAQAVRSGGLRLRASVDTVRSAIIRREFNDRLNLLWRDLFIRLAPGEPFFPAFSIPGSHTQRLQPKLVTLHRDGGDPGGTPGAMLSAGNLNTAALTLFIALHLSVRPQLPWLILDDPVQSMDDVHIAHFAALLRTLAKDHGRQVMIAVHDRQLFEYLKLELSPAYPNDSLLTLELSRSARRDTLCVAERLTFRVETTLRNAA